MIIESSCCLILSFTRNLTTSFKLHQQTSWLGDYIVDKANYLAALGLSTYTENLGGIRYGHLEHHVRTNYVNFIEEYFSMSEYNKPFL